MSGNRPDYWPTDGWRRATPEEQRLSGDVLSRLHEFGLDTDPPASGFVVVRDGYLVYEEYFRGFHEGSYHSVNSVTKSVISALIGIALRDGLVKSVEQPMADFFPEVKLDDERKRRVTIQHVLTMTSGFVEHEHFPQALVRSDDPAQLIWSRPLSHNPGEHFLYDNETPHLLSLALSRITGMSPADYAFSELFAPLGIWADAAARSFWRADPFGRHTSFSAGQWPESGLPWRTDQQDHSLGYAGAHFTLREMAKFGWLYLNQGRWGDRQIVPEGYVAESIRPHSTGTFPPVPGAPPPPLSHYGYLWWLRDDYGRSGLGKATTFMASGFGGQVIWGRPEAGMVVALASAPRVAAPVAIGRIIARSIRET